MLNIVLNRTTILWNHCKCSKIHFIEIFPHATIKIPEKHLFMINMQQKQHVNVYL